MLALVAYFLADRIVRRGRGVWSGRRRRRAAIAAGRTTSGAARRATGRTGAAGGVAARGLGGRGRRGSRCGGFLFVLVLFFSPSPIGFPELLKKKKKTLISNLSFLSLFYS